MSEPVWHELPLPSLERRIGAYEVISAWIDRDRQSIACIGTALSPEDFGVFLSEMVSHAAIAYCRDKGLDEAEVRTRIVSTLSHCFRDGRTEKMRSELN
jgi:hypothetical protein